MRRNCIRLRGVKRRSCAEHLRMDRRCERNLERRSGNESAADTHDALAGLLFPDGLQFHANWRKNGHMQNSQKIFGKILGRIQFYSDTAKAQIEDARAAGALLAKN